ncbi:NotI family restriction endonuclease [Akkermansia muciniphila]|jgi:hypothetical protein|uniref:NotI family restriction endonuclease n=1 Tax=Akkermansia muciniphila TaxID=239935 RepID=UPI001C061AE3|nr:NotI family restriction endonuclease [Akkermansia muciniphila]QWP06126.1 hypothetical protein J5W77_03470 [Akkermansia muciniphila]QWP23697.1 hypothetical protein J5W81_09430 [Akkermansia muciniphila]QWP29915.1 hypothetical protein J5W80_03445 [Akkermansia muciniphila]
MSKISELFTVSGLSTEQDWQTIVSNQYCHYIGRKCLKNRKSQPEISIGTCTVKYGEKLGDVIICPHRLLERKQIFMDCIHLLSNHEPGNELHILPEVTIPGGCVDYFIVSTNANRKVQDFVGIELQTLDTTGTVWPERQRFLKEKGLMDANADTQSVKTFGMNWKMTAKTTLVQLHHKIETFENLGKHLVLVIQDCLVDYIKKEFSFSHISNQPKLGDSMHFHSYSLSIQKNKNYKIELKERYSTDSIGISKLLGLQAKANIELEVMLKILEAKISDKTLFTI